jgi:Holliday junction resolvase RusA-like endonuclease
MTLTFRVIGVAQPKGNMRSYRGTNILTDANKSLKGWQTLVAAAASHAIQRLDPTDRAMLAGAVALSIAFYFPRPLSLKRSIVANIRRPDIDKCVRAVQDALERVAYFDDAQIVNLVAAKRYARIGESPYVDVSIAPAAGLYPLALAQPLFDRIDRVL